MSAAAAARPLVTVQILDSDMATDSAGIPLPAVMKASIRPDIVNFVHSNISKNSRQPYAVSRKAGHQTSAESWGTGRAVSRIPRVPGGGTHRAGQGAFGNMCRGGRMFAPTRIWRRWHRKINVNQKRYAVVSAIAASAVPSLVMARGHKVETVPELPLVVSDSVEGIEKTKNAIDVLKNIGAYADAEKAKDSAGIRPGVGKMRNRRYISRKGPLVVYGTEGAKLVKAFRNIPGVEVANVERLNLLKLAPGGHLGRFVIWTKSAFEKLDSIYGSFEKKSEKKRGYVLPRAKMENADLARIINSDEVQSVVRPIKTDVKRAAMKKNPLKNLNTMLRLNPYAKTAKRMAVLAEEQRKKAKKEKLDSISKMDFSDLGLHLLWDIENSHIEGKIDVIDTLEDIKKTLRASFPNILIENMIAIGNSMKIRTTEIDACHNNGISIFNVPAGNKNAADTSIIVNLFKLARVAQSPSIFALITGDADFCEAMDSVRQLGHITILIYPEKRVAKALKRSDHFTFSWEALYKRKVLEDIERNLSASSVSPRCDPPVRYVLSHLGRVIFWDIDAFPLPDKTQFSSIKEMHDHVIYHIAALVYGVEIIEQIVIYAFGHPRTFPKEGMHMVEMNTTKVGMNYIPTSISGKQKNIVNKMLVSILSVATKLEVRGHFTILSHNEELSHAIHFIRSMGHAATTAMPSSSRYLGDAATNTIVWPEWETMGDDANVVTGADQGSNSEMEAVRLKLKKI